MDLKEFAKELNEGFGPPFLPPDFVRARVTERGTLWFEIGHRDVEFDGDLKRVGSGTGMCIEDRWLIKKGAETPKTVNPEPVPDYVKEYGFPPHGDDGN